MVDYNNNIVLIVVAVLFFVFVVWMLGPSEETEKYRFMPEAYQVDTPAEISEDVRFPNRSGCHNRSHGTKTPGTTPTWGPSYGKDVGAVGVPTWMPTLGSTATPEPLKEFSRGNGGCGCVKEGYSPISAASTPAPSDMNKPYADPTTGTIMDGPGFEKGSSENVPQSQTFSSIPANYYFLDDGANGNDSVINNLCSKSCCSETYPPPFKQKYDPYVCENKDKFVPSNIFCNNAFQDSGCLCMTREQQKKFTTRGTNATWY